ncbi:hypothetical protein KIL84_005408 [Mauremys mutica]|uniref:Uncharacterized protein n=1 Tax=Mauremys mutica TaxID=74926 RepID=A0A9D3XL66_9SAUR|nr:hypothetical protein KIL84_005408 [Mauremys mutica]
MAQIIKTPRGREVVIVPHTEIWSLCHHLLPLPLHDSGGVGGRLGQTRAALRSCAPGHKAQPRELSLVAATVVWAYSATCHSREQDLTPRIQPRASHNTKMK